MQAVIRGESSSFEPAARTGRVTARNAPSWLGSDVRQQLPCAYRVLKSGQASNNASQNTLEYDAFVPPQLLRCFCCANARGSRDRLL